MVGVGAAGPLGTTVDHGDPTPVAGADRALLAVLAAADGIGPRRLGDLLVHHGSPGSIVDAARRVRPGRPTGPVGRRARRRAVPGDPIDPLVAEPDLARRVIDAAGDAGRLADAVGTLGLTIVTLDDPTYPGRLRAIDLPPPVVFVQGPIDALAGERSVAVVGTRRPTEHGRRTASRIAGALTRAGAVVVSGLALGIDGVAHRACLDEDGRTLAVLGSGHAELTPRLHARLAGSIVERGGAILSEFLPWREAATWSFPRRNRIISGLAEATVVVEAGLGSGALITASWALEQGRECFIVPGPVGAAASAGNLRFLRDHHGLARVVADVASLLEDLGLGQERVAEPAPGSAELGPTEARVAERLGQADATVDELAVDLDLSPAGILTVLARLELAGLVVQGLGRYRSVGRLATRSGRRTGSAEGPGPGMAA